MYGSPHRTERISEALREELAELIGYEMSDPRVGDVTVTDVHDLARQAARPGAHRRAGRRQMPKDALAALEHAKRFLRRELASGWTRYRIPELHFRSRRLP